MTDVRHPAKFSDPILDVIDSMLPDGARVLDPFAGVGRIHRLAPRVNTVGIELEPEWAKLHGRTRVGDALRLPFGEGEFDAIATSPTYGNRMADHHEARDGSERRSYTHDLGRQLTKGNSGVLQWGAEYRLFHIRAWREAMRVLKDGGLFALNISNHYRDKKVARVSEWHIETLVKLGLGLRAIEVVGTRRYRYGENADARVAHEFVVLFAK